MESEAKEHAPHAAQVRSDAISMFEESSTIKRHLKGSWKNIY